MVVSRTSDGKPPETGGPERELEKKPANGYVLERWAWLPKCQPIGRLAARNVGSDPVTGDNHSSESGL
jgi:hypothetical protein